ncbi:DUF4326 domain-containing protein [Haloplanus rubicundus]|uniref:DUF4326 domain-containing protein n=1 Tax=Haloplanus rubicundus TaxID=1547898 RepID=A0A345EBV8_9EURY|nr:DUF4326 domain-containing protein [Haloplanus rubicundus]
MSETPDPTEDPLAAVRTRVRGDLHVPETDHGRRIVHEPSGTELISGRRFEPTRWVDRRSRFGNPFKLVKDGGEVESREQSVALYEGWFRGNLVENGEFAEAVQELYGERLGCWCLPQQCHGEVILRHLAAAYDS